MQGSPSSPDTCARPAGRSFGERSTPRSARQVPRPLPMAGGARRCMKPDDNFFPFPTKGSTSSWNMPLRSYYGNYYASSYSRPRCALEHYMDPCSGTRMREKKRIAPTSAAVLPLLVPAETIDITANLARRRDSAGVPGRVKLARLRGQLVVQIRPEERTTHAIRHPPNRPLSMWPVIFDDGLVLSALEVPL